MNEVARIQPATMPVPAQSETAAVIHMIERAARDPSVDIDKLNKLLELRTKIEEQQARREFAEGMKAAQTEMRPVAADATNPQTKSKYASYAALDRALRPIYTKHGFSLSFNTGEGAPQDYVRVLCNVMHGAGHTRDYHIDMPADGKGAKGGDVMTKTHATGSAISYGMRYLLKMIFNIAVGDDDGNAAGGSVVSEAQADAIRTAVTEAKADLEKFLAVLKVESIADIAAKDYHRALGMLAHKKAMTNAANS